MTIELPTNPSHYYWRENENSEWMIVEACLGSNKSDGTLEAFCFKDDCWYDLEHWGGQWLSIPSAEELLELQEIKKRVDEGAKVYRVFNVRGGATYSYGRTKREAWDNYFISQHGMLQHKNRQLSLDVHQEQGYTCEPVTVIRKGER